MAAEAAAVVASARLLAVGQVQWAAVWTARMARPVLRVVGAVVAVGWEDQDQEDGAVVVAAEEVEDLDHRREEEEDPAAVLVQDLVVPVPAPTVAVVTITACTVVTVDTAVLEGTAVRLRLITFGTVAVVMAIQENMLGTMAISAVVEEVEGLKWEEILRLINRSPLMAAVAEEDLAEALALPGLALHPDRTTHSRSNHNTSNRIDMVMAGMDLETIVEVVAVASDLLPPNNPTRIRALHRPSGKIIRARIRHNTTDRQDLVVVAEQGVAAVVVWVQVALYILRQRGELPIMNQEWEEEEAGAVLEPLGRVIMTPPISDRDQDLHRHHRLDRCNTSNTNKARPWHLRGQGQTNLLGSLQHRHHLLAKRRAHRRPSKRQSHRRRKNRRNPRYQRGHPLRHQLIHRPNFWHRLGWSQSERRWSFAMPHFSNSIESWRSFVPNEQFWRSFLSVWMLSARSTTLCMAKQKRVLPRVLQQKRGNKDSLINHNS